MIETCGEPGLKLQTIGNVHSSQDRWVVSALARTYFCFCRWTSSRVVVTFGCPFCIDLSKQGVRIAQFVSYSLLQHSLLRVPSHSLCHTNCCSIACSESDVYTPQWETQGIFFSTLVLRVSLSKLTRLGVRLHYWQKCFSFFKKIVSVGLLKTIFLQAVGLQG